MVLLLVGGGVYASLQGVLGDKAQETVAALAEKLWGGCKVPSGANLQELVAANPNFVRQMWDWKAKRIARLENPYDWAAFRTHLTGIGAPDPGPVPPKEFCQ
jgi:hypothetical protein